MKHVHHIRPRHRGGTDEDSNKIKVEVVACNKTTQCHAMWHFCEWQLYGLKEDYLAWKGLCGFMGREEVIYELQEKGRAKGRRLAFETNKKLLSEGRHNFQVFHEKAMTSLRLSLADKAAKGEHPFQDPEYRHRRASQDSQKQKELMLSGQHPFQREDVLEKRKKICSKSKSEQNSKKIKCPHCGKEGGATNMKRYHFDRCKQKQ